MNYYFAPIIPHLDTKVTLVNFPPVGGPKAASTDCYGYAANTDGRVWKVQELGMVARGGTRTFSLDDIPESFTENGIVVFFLYPERLTGTLDQLMISSVMNTAPAWRGNLQFCSRTTSVSFQADYPDSMIPIPNGTMVSICPMVQLGEQVSTILIVNNLKKGPEIEARTLMIGRVKSKEIIEEHTIYTNTSNIIRLEGIPFKPHDPICACSPDMVGVPIYLSFDPKYRYLSLEHSHPPHELTVFGDPKERKGIVDSMKKFWIENICTRSN